MLEEKFDSLLLEQASCSQSPQRTSPTEECDEIPEEVDPVQQYHDEVIEQIFWNDVIMSTVLSHFTLKERRNLEMTCRRMYNLSMKTPCFLGDELHLVIEQYDGIFADDEPEESFFIILLRKNLLSGTHDEILVYQCEKEQLATILKNCSRRFKRSIKIVKFCIQIDYEYLKLCNDFFPYATELFSAGFKKDAIKYLSSPEQKITKKITKLGFEEFDVPPDYFIFNLFKNLRKIHYERSCLDFMHDNFFKNLDKLNTVLDTIRIEYIEIPEDDLTRISKKCKNLELAFLDFRSSSSLERLFMLKNISMLEISLDRFSLPNLVNFFERLNIHKLKEAKIADVEFNDDLLRLLLPEEKSDLIEFKLSRWKRVENSILPLHTIYPKTLIKLKLLYFQTKDFTILPMNCPHLEELEFNPREEEKIDSVSKRYSLYLQQSIFNLPNLKRVETNLYMKPAFLKALCRNRNKIRVAEFGLLGAKGKIFDEACERIWGYGTKNVLTTKKGDPPIECTSRKVLLTFPVYIDEDISEIFCDNQKCSCNID